MGNQKFDLTPIYEHLKRKKYDDISWANHFSELLNYQGNSELHRDYLREQASIIKPEFPDAAEWADIVFVEWGTKQLSWHQGCYQKMQKLSYAFILTRRLQGFH